jgi:hypothetical protein
MPAVHLGHQQNEQDNVGPERLDHGERDAPVGRDDDDAAGVLEDVGERIGDVGVVLDDEDPAARRSPDDLIARQRSTLASAERAITIEGDRNRGDVASNPATFASADRTNA